MKITGMLLYSLGILVLFLHDPVIGIGAFITMSGYAMFDLD
jgi:hypothetical protein